MNRENLLIYLRYQFCDLQNKGKVDVQQTWEIIRSIKTWQDKPIFA